MQLHHTISQGNQSLLIEVDYDTNNQEVRSIMRVYAIEAARYIDITHIIAEHFNLDEVVDKVNWEEKVADHLCPVEDDNEEQFRDY